VRSFNSIAKNNGGAIQSSRPQYLPVGSEEQVFKAAYRQRMSILLKGPTGCCKTRFVEAMAHDLGRPLITVACHDDLTTADLVGRFLLRGPLRWSCGRAHEGRAIPNDRASGADS
jgi:nitric oxide reductase NorQ protein